MKRLSIIFLYCMIHASFSDSINNNTTGEKNGRPHIVIIVADDLGWNDVSFHGSNQIPTPNIDALAYNGVILNNYYTSAVCTPSRASLLTGKYATHLGMQHLVLLPSEPRGLPLSEKLLPQYLKEAGYATHLVGKWHLGFYKKEYTPLFRGFDSHFGFWNGHQDYYNHNFMSSVENCGFDMRRNMTVAVDTVNKYSTDLFTDESVRLISSHNKESPFFLYLAHAAVHSGNDNDLLQAPDNEILKFEYIDNPERRTYAAMVSKLDESVGRVVAALRDQGMLDNSIIVFISDNGAMTTGRFYNRGSNYPLRGMKGSGWEGAVHGVAAVWSPRIEKSQRVSDQLMHVADWLPTFLSAAGIPTTTPTIDGLDMWQAISADTKSPRGSALINIDEIWNYSAIRVDNYKYLTGRVGFDDNWHGDPGASDKITISYDPIKVLKSEAAISTNSIRTHVLTAQTIQRLRSEATIRCNISEEQMVVCQPERAPCLFNIKTDPCEMKNIISTEPEVAKRLEALLKEYQASAVPASNLPEDRNGDARNWGGVWIPWRDADVLYDSSIRLQCGIQKHSDSLPSSKTYDYSYISLCAFGGLFIITTTILSIWLIIKNIRRRRNSDRIEVCNGDDRNYDI